MPPIQHADKQVSSFVNDINQVIFILLELYFNFGFIHSFFYTETFAVKFARNWKTFTIGGKLYLAVACSGDSFSPIYSFQELEKEKVIEYQRIPVTKVFAVEPVKIGKELFLIFVSIHGPSSSVYRWSSSEKIFVKHQVINAYGTGIESFRIGERYFLAFTGEKY